MKFMEWAKGIFQEFCIGSRMAKLFADIIYLESQNGGVVVNLSEFGCNQLLKCSPNGLDLVRG